MNLKNRSLVRRLVFGQLIVVISFSVLTTGNLLWQFQKNGEGDLDQALTKSAQSVLVSLARSGTQPADLPRVAALSDFLLRQFVKSEDDTVQGSTTTMPHYLLRVIDGSGNEIFRTPEYAALQLPSLAESATSLEIGGNHWRTATVTNHDRSLAVQVMQSEQSIDFELCDIVSRFIFAPLLWFLPFAGLATWLTVSHGLSPLRAMAERISHRSPTDLTPVSGVTKYDETAPLVDEINALLTKLRETLAREREFLADAAHELRTPLAVIQAQAHVLEHAPTLAERSVASSELHEGVARAANLIQKLLLSARVSEEDFAPSFQRVNLADFAQDRVASLSAIALKKNIEIELRADAPCEARIDKVTFTSAFDNVLDNAIRYTPEGGMIAVHVHNTTGRDVLVRVSDNGVGIPSELHQRVFERFFRVTGSDQQGSGLGLAIVKQVIDLHGGHVSLAEGVNGKGLTVELKLPIVA